MQSLLGSLSSHSNPLRNVTSSRKNRRRRLSCKLITLFSKVRFQFILRLFFGLLFFLLFFFLCPFCKMLKNILIIIGFKKLWRTIIKLILMICRYFDLIRIFTLLPAIQALLLLQLNFNRFRMVQRLSIVLLFLIIIA
jgi:hypothetical protein